MAKHFPKEHILHKIINKNNNKIAYSTTPNMGQIIAGHNKKLLNDYYKENQQNIAADKHCDCTAEPCPVDGQCFKEDVIYKAEVSADNTETKNYIGLAATTFKIRYRNHKSSSNNENSKQSTTLSTYIWKMKNEQKNPRTKFSIIKQSKSFNPEIGKCYLCTAEKMEILKFDSTSLLNKCSEILSSCRHRKKFMLDNLPKK